MKPDQQEELKAVSDPSTETHIQTPTNRFWGGCYHMVHGLSWLIILLIVLCAVALISLQTGIADGLVSSHAQSALSRMGAMNNAVDVEKTVLRLTTDGKLAVEARNIAFENAGEVQVPLKIAAEKTQMKIDPIELLSGQMHVSEIHISDVSIRLGEDYEAAPFVAKIEMLDQVPEQIFAALAQTSKIQQLEDIKTVTLANVFVHHPALEGKGGLTISNGEITFEDGQILKITAQARLGDDDFSIDMLRASSNQSAIEIAFGPLDVDFETKDPDPSVRSGLKSELSGRINIASTSDNETPLLEAYLHLEDGILKMGGEETDLGASEFFLSYDSEKKSIELNTSIFKVAQSTFPLKGGLIDASNFNADPESGLSKAPKNSIIYDLVVDEGYLAPTDTDEAPIVFSAKAFGSYDPAERRLVADELLVATGDKYMVGNSVVAFQEDRSPEIILAVEAPKIETSVAKQLWPFWLGRGTRNWAIDNIYGGNLHDLKFWLHVDAGRFSNPERPIRHDDADFQVDYRFERARVNLVGEMPPIRNASGAMKIRGEQLEVSLQKGTSFFPSNRKIDVASGSTFKIENTNNVPLMAEIDVNLTGWADAAIELIGFKPIDASGAVDIRPEQISGLVDANIKARFGLIQTQSPPKPDWHAQLNLSGVDLSKPIEDRILTNITGSLDVTEKRAKLDAKLKLDGINVNANVTEPIGKSGVEKQLILTGTLAKNDRDKLGLGLDNIIYGNAGFTMTRLNGTQDKIEIDLTKSRVVAPATGWEKAKNIAAKASFTLTRNGKETKLTNFKFFGKGFSAGGALTLDDNGLKSAEFANVKLAPKDDYGFSLSRSKGNYKIKLSGASLDMRPLIALLKKNGDKERRAKRNEAGYDLTGKLEKAVGFGGEVLTNVDVIYSERSTIPTKVLFSGRTKINGSVATQLVGDASGENITIASDDAGAFWRFFDIYAFVQGGALDLRITQLANKPYYGQALMRNFKVIGDDRLNKLVSTRASAKELSLNEALKGKLDVSRVTFDQATIDFTLNNGRMDISNGIVRGPQIGASFKGMLYDQKDYTDMSGTFMPAYAVNRIFGEIPLLGALLGNGNDKALLGITFRVSGKSDDPAINVNPLSAIAPGVFRNIFAYQ